MSFTKSNSIALKIAIGALGVAFVFGLLFSSAMPAQAALTQSQVDAIISLLQSFGADSATINNVRVSLTGGTPTTTGGGTTIASVCPYTWSNSLTTGSKGADVLALQKFLNSDSATQIASSGVGSAGNETDQFGSLTKSAVAKFQDKYASEVLTPVGLSKGAGYFGSSSRAKANALCATASTAGGDTTTGGGTTTVGTGLTVSTTIQPASSLAPDSAVRIPFTNFVVTAGSDGDVVMNGVTVERTGLSADTAFASIVLLDEDGNQVGLTKTLNSNHQAKIGEAVTIKSGTSKKFTVAANMVANNATRDGGTPRLDVVGIDTPATISGSLPIVGIAHTINASLAIGTATPTRGSLDPSADAGSKEIGTKGYTFSSLKISAGSAEKIRLKSVRWNQSGSASASDLENIVTIVDGVTYSTMVSSDGKYYTSKFGDGIVIDKGLSQEVSVKGDIVSGSARTVTFDLYKGTDIYITGETFGYGIAADDQDTTVGSATEGTFNDELTPAYPAYDVTISAGSVNSISKSNTVAAQNIAILASNVPLGAFEVEIRGEPISVQQMIFNLQATGDEAENITSISLVDQNGSIVAGPVDGASTATDSAHGTVTFTDTVTFPIGKTTISLKGKLGSAFVSNDTVAASTTPSTQWTTIKGQNTGETVSLSTFSSAITANTMTVKSGALAINVSSQPTARNVIAGAKGFEFARYTLDASQSGEDVKLSNLPLEHTLGTVTNSQLSNCNLYEGSTNLTNDTNVTLAASASDTTFTFNNGGYVVPKGTQKTLSMKCDLSAGATSGTVKWGLSALSSYTSATTVGSNQTVAETATANAGNTMTAATSGSYTVTNDTSLLYKTAQAGKTGVELARLRFTSGATEAIDLKQIALQLGNTASNSPADLVGERVTLWNGSTQIGTAQFGGANSDNATSTALSPAPRVSAGESILITVKGDLSAQNVNEGTPGAFLAITYDGNNNGINGNYATGVDSNTTIDGGTTSDVTTNGLRIFRTVPTLAVTSSGGGTGSLTAGANLYSFTVTNSNNRDVVFNKFSFSIATSGSASINAFTLYGDNVAFNTTATSTTASETLLEFEAADTSEAKIVPANSTKTYIVKAGTVTNPSTTVVDSITLALLADTSYPSIANLVGTVTTVEAGTDNTDNIIWSPFSTTTPVATLATESNLDWTNGYGLPGFPSNTAFSTQTWSSSN